MYIWYTVKCYNVLDDVVSGEWCLLTTLPYSLNS